MPTPLETLPISPTPSEEESDRELNSETGEVVDQGEAESMVQREESMAEEKKGEIKVDAVIKEFKQGEEAENDWPTPKLVDGEEDKKTLIQQQYQDQSLEKCLAWAHRGEHGYRFRDSLLCHEYESSMGDTYVRIVVPKCRHEEVLRLSHSSLTGGHYSHNRTEAVMRRLFTWPGISRHVVRWCQACPEYQKSTKGTFSATASDTGTFQLAGIRPGWTLSKVEGRE